MKRYMSAKAVSRAGIIAALYVVLTMCFGEMAYGPLQIRPSEALCVLPLIYAESVPGLAVGCLIANIVSGYGIYDIFFGTMATLAAACLTRIIGKYVKNAVLKAVAGGIFPVLFNAFAVPAIWLLAGEDASVYWMGVLSVLVTEIVWVYGLGSALYAVIYRLAKRGTAGLVPEDKPPRGAKHAVISPETPQNSDGCASGPAPEAFEAGKNTEKIPEGPEEGDISTNAEENPREKQ